MNFTRQVCLAALSFAAALLLFVGCAGSKPTRSTPSNLPDRQSRIAEIHVLAMPVALNLDEVPGVDGFAIQIYAVDPSQPKTQSIQNGTIDILMYDGLLRQAVAEESQYRHVWSYSAAELKAYANKAAIGTGYRFTLNWGKDSPSHDKITVVVRYRIPQGNTIYSTPSFITVAAK